MQKNLLLFLIIAVLFSCRQKPSPAIQNTIAKSDSIKFSRVIVPDTLGCGWFFNDRHIKDTLIDELADIKKLYTFSVSSSGTLLTTKKYRNLLACSIPS